MKILNQKIIDYIGFTSSKAINWNLLPSELITNTILATQGELTEAGSLSM